MQQRRLKQIAAKGKPKDSKGKDSQNFDPNIERGPNMEEAGPKKTIQTTNEQKMSQGSRSRERVKPKVPPTKKGVAAGQTSEVANPEGLHQKGKAAAQPQKEWLLCLPLATKTWY
ncbi:hypothetical protein GN956_G15962 [Arapaima gigas]